MSTIYPNLIDWIAVQPKVIGTDWLGNPIEGNEDSRGHTIQMWEARRSFMPYSRAKAIADAIRQDTGVGVSLPRVAQTTTPQGTLVPTYNTKADPLARQFYMIDVAGLPWEAGQLFAIASQNGVGAPGKWRITPDGDLSFGEAGAQVFQADPDLARIQRELAAVAATIISISNSLQK